MLLAQKPGRCRDDHDWAWGAEVALRALRQALLARGWRILGICQAWFCQGSPAVRGAYRRLWPLRPRAARL